VVKNSILVVFFRREKFKLDCFGKKIESASTLQAYVNSQNQNESVLILEPTGTAVCGVMTMLCARV